VITIATNKVTLLDADSRTVFFVTNNTYTDVAMSKNKEFCWLYDEELACLRSRRIAVKCGCAVCYNEERDEVIGTSIVEPA